MYEEKKNADGRSVALKLFVGFPWVVKAFFNLFVLVLIALLVFGFAEHTFGIPLFGTVSTELTGFLKLIVGAIIGALSAEAKMISESKKQLELNQADVADDERS